jgi:hypothetical protein
MKGIAADKKKEMNDRFVLAALSVPLNNKLTNFERLSFSYLPYSMRQFDQSSLMGREELLETAKML